MAFEHYFLVSPVSTIIISSYCLIKNNFPNPFTKTLLISSNLLSAFSKALRMLNKCSVL